MSNESNCKQGHAWTEENTYIRTNGRRRCRACQREWERTHGTERNRKWRKDNPEKVRARHHKYHIDNIDKWRKHRLQSKYGITPEDYDKMLEAQRGVCAICRNKPGKTRFPVDHNHETGKIRGLLCTPCNLALGGLNDSHETLVAAEIYLSQDAPRTGLKIDFGLPEGFVSPSTPHPSMGGNKLKGK